MKLSKLGVKWTKEVAKNRPFKFTPRKKSEAAPKRIVAEEKPQRMRKVLNRENHDQAKQLPLGELVYRIISLAQVLIEKPYYPYQNELAYRIVESVLDHDGETISCLMARQAGKTETIGGVVAALGIILPQLAKQYPDDWRLNITDEAGYYRGFAKGFKVGIYAPRKDQAEITFDRVRKAFGTNNSLRVLKECKLSQEVNNGNTLALSNGTRILCKSASEQSKIEGDTHHFLIAEECQDLSDKKIRKSLHPMVASTFGTIVKIGTASTQKGDFYTTISNNRRRHNQGGKRNDFFFPWTVCAKFNSMYRSHIEMEKERIGEDSDEFRMSYNGEWIFERGMFITQELLYCPEIAQVFKNAFWSEYRLDAMRKLQAMGYSIVVGIDWGATSDSTVLCFMAVNWNNPLNSIQDEEGDVKFEVFQKHIIGWMEWVGDNYETQFHEIYDTLKNMGALRKIVMDSNGAGAPMFARFEAAFADRNVEVVPFNFQAHLKSDGYKSLASDFHAKRITFPMGELARKTSHYKKFVQQMLDLRKEYKNGLLSVAHPDDRGAHDDYPDACMLAAYGCNSSSSKDVDFNGLGRNPLFN